MGTVGRDDRLGVWDFVMSGRCWKLDLKYHNIYSFLRSVDFIRDPDHSS